MSPESFFVRVRRSINSAELTQSVQLNWGHDEQLMNCGPPTIAPYPFPFWHTATNPVRFPTLRSAAARVRRPAAEHQIMNQFHASQLPEDLGGLKFSTHCEVKGLLNPPCFEHLIV